MPPQEAAVSEQPPTYEPETVPDDEGIPQPPQTPTPDVEPGTEEDGQ